MTRAERFLLLSTLLTCNYEHCHGYNHLLPSSSVLKKTASIYLPSFASTTRLNALSFQKVSTTMIPCRTKNTKMVLNKRRKNVDWSLFSMLSSSVSSNSNKNNSTGSSLDHGVEGDFNNNNGYLLARTTTEENQLELLQLINAQLQEENDRLKRELSNQNSASYARRRPTIVLESFEPGEPGVLLTGRIHQQEHDFMPQEQQWCDEVEADSEECPLEPGVRFQDAVRDRAYWLVGLLAAQSCSGFILARNEELLQNHPEIIFFLTMLIGAGGNAGNQASVRVIRGLALGTLNEKTRNQFLTRELKMAFALSSILSVAGFLRASLFQTPFAETVAVTASLYVIVLCSICLGAVLPLGLRRIGVDPAHSSTTIQVLMDILGVVLTVIISGLILDTPMGRWFLDSFLVSHLQ